MAINIQVTQEAEDSWLRNDRQLQKNGLEDLGLNVMRSFYAVRRLLVPKPPSC